MAGSFFKEEIFNEMVTGLIFLKNSRPFCSPSSPPLSVIIPRRKRSRQITLQGIRNAKKEEEEEGKEKILNLQASNDRKVGPAATATKKKKARTDSMTVEHEKYLIQDGGHMKLIIRRIPCSSSSESKGLHQHLPPPSLY